MGLGSPGLRPTNNKAFQISSVYERERGRERESEREKGGGSGGEGEGGREREGEGEGEIYLAPGGEAWPYFI